MNKSIITICTMLPVFYLSGMPSSYAEVSFTGTADYPTTISGYTGVEILRKVGEYAFTETRRTDSEYAEEYTVEHNSSMGIHQLIMKESNDRPCNLKIFTKPLDDGEATAYSNTYGYDERVVSTDICSGSDSKSLSVEFINPDMYIRGIEVCTTNKSDPDNDRIKGLRIYPAKVTQDGLVTSAVGSKEDTNPNCNNNWKGAVYCPSGMIASGLRMYHNDDWYRGLSLICRQVTYK